MGPFRTHLLILNLLVFIFGHPKNAGTTELITCFTPGQNCEEQVAIEIEKVKNRLRIQAYGFTSTRIIKAIAEAHERGVDVKILLDKINDTDRYSAATYLTNKGILVLIDHSVAIAHNKVIIIDDFEVITGSFNFTQAAQRRNAENIIFIKSDPNIIDKYFSNWTSRAAVSRPLKPKDSNIFCGDRKRKDQFCDYQ